LALVGPLKERLPVVCSHVYLEFWVSIFKKVQISDRVFADVISEVGRLSEGVEGSYDIGLPTSPTVDTQAQ
jgi:hypothetical protein